MITLYSTGCPKCELLERRLNKDSIKFEISDDVDELIELGFQTAPVLKINDQYFTYKDAMDMLKKYESGIIAEFGGAV